MELSPAELAELQTIFKAECGEHLSALNSLLMSLERRPDDADAINETFRRMHSVKGAARMVGLAGIEAVAHSLETMLAPVRDGKRTLASNELELLFDGTDAITEFMGTASGTTADDPKVRSFLSKLVPTNGAGPRTNGKKDPPAAASSAAAAASDEAQAASASAIEIAVESAAGGEMVRVAAEKIDTLIALRGELVRALTVEEDELKSLTALVDDALSEVDRQRRRATLTRGAGSGAGDEPTFSIEGSAELRRRREQLRTALSRMAERHARRTSGLEELRDSLADLRMLPAGSILHGMHRIVRDVALNQGKEADLTITGADVPIDKVVLDAVKEPLIHLVRNAVAHGLEAPDVRVRSGKPRAGAVRIGVSTGTSSATITIEDDGAGIDFERVRDAAIANGFATSAEAEMMNETKLTALLFKPGFSTARATDQFSGRGVGLDVVADRIAELRGNYNVDTVLGKGTRISLRVPVSLLTSSVLAVKAKAHEVCLRQTDIREAVLLKHEDLVNVEGRINATIRGEVMPVVPLASIAGGDGEVFFSGDDVKPAIVIEFGDRRAALVVDSLEGVFDVIVKSLPKPLGQIAGIAGCAILGNGLPVCVLDGEHIVRSAHDRGTRGAVVHAQPTRKRSLLIADDSLTTRTLLRNIMISAGYDVETAVDGIDAWNKVQLRSFDCIMSDIEMPNMNGWEFCERLKRDGRLADTPLVLITSLSKDEERRRGLDLGADAYIVKGLFNETQLLETVERLVA